MLPDPAIELLAAFVDGELSQRQRKAVMRLLQRSSEARAFLRDLQENAHKVKQLPRRKVEPSLVDEVVRAIAERKSQPVQPSVRPMRRRRWLPYVTATLAASLLIAVIGLVYWNSMGNIDNKSRQAAGQKPLPRPEPAPEPKQPVPTPRRQPNPLLAQMNQMTDSTFRDFAAPVIVDRAFTASFYALKKDSATSGQLAYELSKDRAARLDITVKDNAKAVDRLQRAMYEHGIKLVVDSGAKKALGSKKQGKAEYWIFAENLTPEEVTAMMQELSQPDTTGMGRSVPSPYERLTLARIAVNDKQVLSKKLGVEAGKLELAKDQGNSNVQTPKRWERQAIVLSTGASAQPSPEVHRFVNQRRQPRPGTVQVLIKIRQD